MLGTGQEKYLAAYEQKSRLDLSKAKIELPEKINFRSNGKDSIPEHIKDSMLKELTSVGFLEKMLKQQLGEELVMYMHVRADSSTAELEGNGGSQIKVNLQKKYQNGKWINAKKWTTDFDADTISLEIEFSFTGKSKQVLGYTCKEAVSKDSAQKITLWICETLPPSISPGIQFKNIRGAIFELVNKENGLRITLKSIQKVNDSI